MAKIKCPGCGAEVDTDSGTAEFTPPAEPVPVEEITYPPAQRVIAALDAAEERRKTSRFWRRDGK